MTSFKNKLENFVESFPVEPVLAIVFGAGIGFLAADKIQDYLSHLAVERCKNNSIYQLVVIDGFLGEQKHCVSRTRIYGPQAPLKP